MQRALDDSTGRARRFPESTPGAKRWRAWAAAEAATSNDRPLPTTPNDRPACDYGPVLPTGLPGSGPVTYLLKINTGRLVLIDAECLVREVRERRCGHHAPEGKTWPAAQ